MKNQGIVGFIEAYRFTGLPKLSASCHSQNPRSSRFHYRLLSPLESFWAFQFYPIIAEYKSEAMDETHTIYGGNHRKGRAMVFDPKDFFMQSPCDFIE